jgi:hypothetical protein
VGLRGPKREGALPIDDSDGGCDCQGTCVQPRGAPWLWRREHPDLALAPNDVATDNGREIYNVLRARSTKHVLFVGVHTNMRAQPSLRIRQMVRWGFDVGLVRDLTDGMYNPQRPPHVSHQQGVGLIIEHIERHWCPTVASAELLDRS